MDGIHALIGPDDGNLTLAQACMRAVSLFFFGIACMRITGRRSFSGLSPFDVFMAIVIGSNISRVMIGKVPVIPSLAGTLLIAVLHRLLAVATVRSSALSVFLKGRPQILVRNGIANPDTLGRNNVSKEDLEEALRLGGLENVGQARLVTFERGGKISVIARDGSAG